MKSFYVNEAILSAEKSDMKVSNHGAIIVYRGKIVGRGYNKYISEKNSNNWSIHAEVDAINNALRKISRDDLTKSTLIVVRKLKDNSIIQNNKTLTCSESIKYSNIGYSAPCKNCTNYIIKNGIKTCYYS